MADGRVTIDTELDNSGFKSGLSKLGSVAKVGFAAAGAAITGAAAAVGALSKSALDAYASYEQLTGGVETLFDTSSAKVMEYADQAYQTAGLSANQYMDTVTSFSASLLQGLGGDTAAAADVANKAIIDMADNANKMGTDIASIQQAYQGFAKQNYTMLDNLKLGYGGTQAEMARLINDSGVLGDSMKVTAQTVNQVSFDKIIEAIHKVQVEMGISGISAQEAADLVASGALTQEEAFELMGTTAKEASSTIEGSLNAAKAAWGNLLVGVADDTQDFDALVDNFVNSVGTAAENVLPRLVKILEGAGKLIENLAPIIADALPQLLESTLPALLSAGAQLVVALIRGIVESIPTIAKAMPKIIDATVTALRDLFPEIVDAGFELLGMLVDGIINGIPVLMENLPQIIISFIKFVTDNRPKLIEQGVKLIVGVAKGLIEGIPHLVEHLPEVIKAFVDGLAALSHDIVKAGADIVRGLWEGIKSMAGWIGEKVRDFSSGILKTVKNFFGIHSPSAVFRDEVGYMLGLGVAKGLDKSASKAAKAAESLAKSVYNKSKEWVDLQTKYFDMSLKDQLEVWQTIQSQFVKDSQQYADAEKEILDVRAKAQDDYYKKISDITGKISSLENEYLDQLKTRQKEIFDSYGLFDEVAARESVSGEKLVSNLKSQVDTITEYYGKLDQLSSRGVAVGVVDELRKMGPDAINELDALLSLTDEKLSEYSSLYAEKQKLANEIALEQLKPLREETDAEIKGMMDELDNLTEENAPIIGKSLADGIRDGIMEQQESVVNAVDRVMQRIEQRSQEAAARIQSAVSAIIGRIPQLDTTVSGMAPVSVSTPRFSAEKALSNAAGMLAMSQNTRESREIVLNLNGREVARGLVDDIRTVDKQTPAIQFS